MTVVTLDANVAPPPTYRDELAFARYLAHELEHRLAGRDRPTLLRQVPGDVCHLGVLAPAFTPAADDPRPSSTSAARRALAALGAQLLVAPPADGESLILRVTPRFAIYTRHFAPWEVQRRELGSAGDANTTTPETAQRTAAEAPARSVRLVDMGIRHTIAPGPLTFTLDPAQAPLRFDDAGQVQAALTARLEQAAADPQRPFWRSTGRRSTISATALASPESYAAFLDRFESDPPSLLLRAGVEVRARRTGSGPLLIQVFLRNTTPRSRDGDAFNVLLDCQVQIDLVQGNLVPIELTPVPAEYQYDRRVWALGHACSADVDATRRVVQTRTLALHAQPRLGSRDDPPARLADLERDPIAVLAAIDAAMNAHAGQWQRDLEAWIAQQTGDPASWQAEQQARERDLAGFRQEQDRFACGIAALRADSRLQTAFCAMQRVFQRISAGHYDRWRLFQIVFIVSQLPALAIRENLTTGEWPPDTLRQWADTLEQVDVLWFPTGGGKTEAYFGLICCAMLYDRLRGKEGGTTAWLRFPLRMLSVQQVQRAIRLVWETEQERLALEQQHGRPLGDPLALGYLVGRDMTPNSLRPTDDTWSLPRIARDPVLREKVHLVRTCPACATQGAIDVQVDTHEARIRLACTQCGAVLPVYVSDEEILRFLPSLLISTVDKLAATAYRAALAALWNGPNWRCSQPGHGYGTGRWCAISSCPTNPGRATSPAPRTPVQFHDPAPTLHIQDELHLLQQELGTFAGHYEAMVRVEERERSGLPAKVIAATATIEGFAHQTRHLYGAPAAVRFPGRDQQVDETFYTRVRRDADGVPQVARLYLAFQPPHLSIDGAASLCTATLHRILADLHQNPYAAVVAAGLQDARSAAAVRALLHCYDTSVTYVGTKHVGTRVAEALDQVALPRQPAAVPTPLSVRLLSGDTPFGEIAQVIEALEDAPAWDTPAHLDALVATSVISHGVDVARLNLLILDSVPGDIAEYIQASSRSGRRHVGLIVTVLPPRSRRAASIYQRFTEFHQHLDRMVGPIPVNRFARSALARTFPGVVLSALYSRNLAEATRTDLDTVYALSSSLASALEPSAISALAAQVYGLNRGTYPPALEAQARTQIAEQAALFCAALARFRSSAEKYLWRAFTPAPMTSLRDIDAALPFAVSPDLPERTLRWFQRDTGSSDQEQSA